MFRNRKRFSPFLAVLSIALGTTLLTGCSSQPDVASPPEPVHSAPKSPGDKSVTPTRLAQGNDTLDAETDDYARRLAQALEARNNPGSASPAPAPTTAAPTDGKSIDWVDPDYLRTANAPKPEAEANSTTPAPQEKTDTPTVETPPKPAPEPVTTKPAPTATQSDADRAALLKQIRDRVTDSNDAAVHKAMSLAALAIVDPSFQLDENELAALPPTQRELVRQFHGLFASLGNQVASGQPVDRNALGDRLNAIIGEQPLAIRNVKLCDRVRSFGVYEELPGSTFLAGREHPMVVYVELDHFKSIKSGAMHEVKLSQELVLYNDSDGLAVWRQPEQQIVDESRNQRRDFYVVQPTRLPARLGVGKFVLKVRVRDLHGGTRDEVSIPINVVADPALVKPDVKRERDGKAG